MQRYVFFLDCILSYAFLTLTGERIVAFMMIYGYSTKNKKNRKPEILRFFGGLFRIRTGVDGFADRYLATRSRDHFLMLICECKGTTFFRIYQIFFYFIRKLLHQCPRF